VVAVGAAPVVSARLRPILLRIAVALVVVAVSGAGPGGGLRPIVRIGLGRAIALSGVAAGDRRLGARGRRRERGRRRVLQRIDHEIAKDRRDDMAAGLVVAERSRLVEPDIAAGDEVWREADEPRVVEVVGGAGLAGERLADRGGGDAGALLHDPLH